jgi:NADH-quinone oxidoreductase subunit M
MLGVVQKMFFGPLDNPKNRGLRDMNVREIVAVAPLVALVFVIGLFPDLFLSRMAPAAQVVVERYQSGREVFGSADPNRTAAFLVPRRGGPLERGYPQPKAPEKPSEAPPAEQALNAEEVTP